MDNSRGFSLIGDCSDQSHGQDHLIVPTEGGTSLPNIITTENPDAIKAKIISHPHFSNLLQAYMDCQKVGAPPEVVERLTAVRRAFESTQRAMAASRDDSKDPELDHFMEAYHDMLVKHGEELSRPVEEAMDFIRRTESELDVLQTGIFNSGVGEGGIGGDDGVGPETDQ